MQVPFTNHLNLQHATEIPDMADKQTESCHISYQEIKMRKSHIVTKCFHAVKAAYCSNILGEITSIKLIKC